MGLRYRGRSKGKNAWVNWSWSKKNGLGLSASVKAGLFTWNSGNGKSTKKRITTNLPGGFYHVTSSSSPKRRTTRTASNARATQSHYNVSTSTEPKKELTGRQIWIILGVLFVAYLIFL